MQTGSPTHLVLIGEIPGDGKMEKALHCRLSRFRWRGEWFEYRPFVRDVIIEEMVRHLADEQRYEARLTLENQLPRAVNPPILPKPGGFK